MADQTPPLPENLAALVGSVENPTRPSDFRSAWVELVGYVRQGTTWNQQIDSAQLLDYLQELHDRNHLPPELSPKRDAP